MKIMCSDGVVTIINKAIKFNMERLFYKVFIIVLLNYSLVIAASSFTQSPANCLKKKIAENCYFGTASKYENGKIGSQEFYLSKKTILNLNHEKISFIEGELLLIVNTEMFLKLNSAEVKLIPGEYLFKNYEGEVLVRTLSGIANIQTESQDLKQVTEGFEITLRSDAELKYSSLRLIPMEEHILTYSKLKRLSASEIINYTKVFQQKHQNYKRWYEELNHTLVERMVADEESKKQAELEKVLRAKKAKKILRDQFFYRTFER